MMGFLWGHVLTKDGGKILLLSPHGVAHWIVLAKGKTEPYELGDFAYFFLVDHVSSQGERTLFGLESSLDVFWFHVLTKIPGLGGKTAQNILGFYDARALYGLLLEENFVLLQRVDGVGLKMAQRVVQELKEKLSSIAKELHSLEIQEEQQKKMLNFLRCHEEKKTQNLFEALKEQERPQEEKKHHDSQENFSHEECGQLNKKHPSLGAKKQQWTQDYHQRKVLYVLEKEALDILEGLGYGKEERERALKTYFKSLQQENHGDPKISTTPDLVTIVSKVTHFLRQEEL